MTISRDNIDLNFFNKISEHIADDKDNFLMYEEFGKLVKNVYPSRILYGLLKLEFSAYWELSTLLATPDNKTLQIAMSDLIRKGIVTPIYNSSERYDFILKFWKTIYRRSSHPPAFYEIHPKWIDLMKNIESILLENFKGSEPIDLQGIETRMHRYRQHCRKEKAELEKIEEFKRNALGNCHTCDRLIMKNEKRGKAYHKYPIGLICDKCFRDPNKDSSKWMQRK
jgi:hypothetical protein